MNRRPPIVTNRIMRTTTAGGGEVRPLR